MVRNPEIRGKSFFRFDAPPGGKSKFSSRIFSEKKAQLFEKSVVHLLEHREPFWGVGGGRLLLLRRRRVRSGGRDSPQALEKTLENHPQELRPKQATTENRRERVRNQLKMARHSLR